MALSRTLIVGALLLGALQGSTSLGFGESGNQQCYYRPGIDADNSCSTCGDTCLGAGYRCCTIIADPT
jgi:hypothetical protein